MMKGTRHIFNEQGCLLQDTIEASIRGDLSLSEADLVRDHCKDCLLCRNAMQGTRYFNNAEEYSSALYDLRKNWSAKEFKEVKTNKTKLAFLISIAATLLILITITALVRYQKQVRYELLSQLTEQGISIDNAISEIQIRDFNNSTSDYKTLLREDSARNKFLESDQALESNMPVAQIEETVVFPNPDKYDYRDIVTTRQEEKKSVSQQLRSPFRIMSHPPAKMHYQLPDEASDKDDLFIVVEDMPRFQNGDVLNFRKYILKNIHYPQKALHEEISGRVYVQFVINREGDLVDAAIIKSKHPILDAEVLRVISFSPKWTPGKQRGRSVDVSLIMPVDFVLQR